MPFTKCIYIVPQSFPSEWFSHIPSTCKFNIWKWFILHNAMGTQSTNCTSVLAPNMPFPTGISQQLGSTAGFLLKQKSCTLPISNLCWLIRPLYGNYLENQNCTSRPIIHCLCTSFHMTDPPSFWIDSTMKSVCTVKIILFLSSIYRIQQHSCYRVQS